MIPELIIQPDAETDIAEAYDWYESRLPGLGSDFLSTIDGSFSAIQFNPLQFPAIYKNLRRALVRRFPYQIFFVHEEHRIVILAVLHARRSPKRWMKRGA